MAKKRILIAEDEALVAVSVKLKLESWGYDVVDIVTEGKTVITHSRQHPPDLILMDICLADDINGIDAVKEIHKFNNISVIYITASEDPDTFQKAQETTYHDFISKPYNFENLKTSIEKLFST